MPTVKSASKFNDRQGAAVIAIITGGFFLFLSVVSYIPDGPWQKVAGVIWFIGTAAALFALLVRMGRAFICPDCGGPVGPLLSTDDKASMPLLRHCAKCDVLWHVGSVPD